MNLSILCYGLRPIHFTTYIYYWIVLLHKFDFSFMQIHVRPHFVLLSDSIDIKTDAQRVDQLSKIIFTLGKLLGDTTKLPPVDVILDIFGKVTKQINRAHNSIVCAKCIQFWYIYVEFKHILYVKKCKWDWRTSSGTTYKCPLLSIDHLEEHTIPGGNVRWYQGKRYI